jgi:hypothetical protein
MTYDNATLKLYVDGVAAGHVSINRVRTTSPAPLVFGRRGDAAHYYKGMLDDVQLYSQALSVADIAALVGSAPLPLPASPPATSQPLAGAVTPLTGLSSLAGVSSLATVSPLTAAATTFSLAAVTTYKASTDFSGVQGQRGWFYRDSAGRNMTYNSTTRIWQGAETYLRIWGGTGHPGNGADAVRRWVAPSAGTIQITGNASHAASTGGVTVSIRKGSTILWQQALTTSTSYNVTTTVTAGQAIDFHINRGADGNWNNDTTVFDPTITLTTGGTAPPPPSGGSATVTWNANTESDLAGYRVYYGTSSRTITNYPNSISVGKVMTATISGLTKGTKYYFAVKAVDTSGNLSGYSLEVTKTP